MTHAAWSEHHKSDLILGGWRPGKVRPKRTMKMLLGDPASWPVLPDILTYGDKAPNALSQMYLNNRLGCCVVAALLHGRGVTSANGGGPDIVFSDQNVTDLYGPMSGGSYPSSDSGCDEDTAMDVAESLGYPDGIHELAHASVDATNWDEVCMAIYLFEFVISGQGLPAPWVAPFPSPGSIWDVAGPSVPTNGHAVMYPGYDRCANVLDTRTWGIKISETRAALAAYAAPAGGGELWVPLNADIIARATQKAPTMQSLAQLQQDLGLLSTVQ